MRYRKFPNIPDTDVSLLGFGCMRLPTVGADPASIDEAEFDAMLAEAAASGVTYLDTAYPYHKGMSEGALGAALDRTGLRKSFTLATKCPVWLVNEEGDWDRFLDEQLKRLRTDHIDFYLLHALNTERWDTIQRLKGLEAMERAKADGRIRHLGFSFHDSLSSFKTIVDGYDRWEFCQIQYNYVDTEYQAGDEGLAYAAAKGLGVVIMEPLRGGALASPPTEVLETLGSYEKPRSPVEWALRFAMDKQAVVTVLSGMGSLDQMRENIAVAASVRPNEMRDAEKRILSEARDIYRRRERVPCTGCAYCMPCPSGVDIPGVFAMANGASMFDTLKDRSAWYKISLMQDGKAGDACVSCGQCLPKCPQGISIPERLEESHAYLTSM